MPDHDGLTTGAFFAAPWWAVAPLADAAGHPSMGLNSTELTRAAGYLQGRPRADFVAGRILVRVLAAELLNRALPQESGLLARDLELTQYCPSCASTEHGCPTLQLPDRQNFALSYSRTSGWLLLGLAPANTLLGVDVADPADAAFAPGEGDLLEDYAYAPEERTMLWRMGQALRQETRARWWALKEAVAKASGEGLAGEQGIPVVTGPQRHSLLRESATRVLDLSPGAIDTLGNSLPGNLRGAIVWAPGSTHRD